MKPGSSISNKVKYFILFLSFFISSSFGLISQTTNIDALKKEISKHLGTLSFQEGIQYLQAEIPNYTHKPLVQAEFLHQLALKYHNQGILDSCLVYLPEAIKLRRENNAQALHLGRSLSLMGANYLELFSYQPAKQFINEAIKVFKDSSIFLREAFAQEDLARIYKREGNYKAALYSIKEVKRIYKQEEAVNYLPGAIYIEGAIYDDLNKNEIAEKIYLDGIDFIDKKVGVNNSILEAYKGGIYNNYAILLTKLKKWKQAEDYSIKAIDAFKLRASILVDEKVYLEGQIINVYSNLSKIYNAQNLFEKSLNTSIIGLQMLDSVFQSKKQTIIAELYKHRGTAYAKLNNEKKSLEAFDQSITALLKDKSFPLPKGESLKDQKVLNKLTLLDVLDEKGQAFHALNKERLAFQTYQEADELIEQIRATYPNREDRFNLIRRTREVYEHTLSLLNQLCKQENKFCSAAYRFVAKNKAIFLLEDIHSNNFHSLLNIPDDLLIKEKKLYRKIIKLQSSNVEETDSKELSKLKNEYFNFLQGIKDQYPGYFELKFRINQPLKLKNVQNALPDKSLLIEYFIGEDHIYIIGITKSSYSFEQIEKSKNFQQHCTIFRSLIEQPIIDENYLTISYRLYSLLLKGTLAKHKEVKRLFIIPEKELNLFAFEALLTQNQEEWKGRNNAYLINDYAVSYLYSNQFLNYQSSGPLPTKTYAGFGIEYDDFTLQEIQTYSEKTMSKSWTDRSFGRLFYSDDEVKESQKIWGGNIWLNQKASKDSFLLHGPDAQILHMAMHGLLDEQQPLNSSLVFSRPDSSENNLLRAGDLYNMSLSADLAILSACQTAYEGTKNSSYGISSLARAFTYAGCKSLVASLWNATDKSSKEIVLDFYRSIDEKQAKDIALQEAKLKYLKDAAPAFTHPFYWAPLIHTGKVDPIVKSSSNSYLGVVCFVLVVGIIIWGIKKKKEPQ